MPPDAAAKLDYKRTDEKPKPGLFVTLAQPPNKKVQGFYPASEFAVFKGMRMAGRMGSDRQTTQNLTVAGVDTEKGLLLLKGAVPGPKGGLVLVATAVKEAMKEVSA